MMKKYTLFIFCNLLFFFAANSLFAQEGSTPTSAEQTAQQPQIKQEALPPVPLVKQSQPITLSPATPFPQPAPTAEQAPATPPPTTPPVTTVSPTTSQSPTATTNTEQAEKKKKPVARIPVVRETIILPSGEKSDLPSGWGKVTELKPGEMRLEDVTSPTLPETK